MLLHRTQWPEQSVAVSFVEDLDAIYYFVYVHLSLQLYICTVIPWFSRALPPSLIAAVFDPAADVFRSWSKQFRGRHAPCLHTLCFCRAYSGRCRRISILAPGSGCCCCICIWWAQLDSLLMHIKIIKFSIIVSWVCMWIFYTRGMDLYSW